MGKRLIAVYLPQYHPIKENNEWWGEGFTEWTNVAKARPRFPGHYQPHLPANLGFYDLRIPEIRQQQAELAKEYGIYGFCYYHYWFNGSKLLERPLEEMLTSGKPDFPFMMCWANENWTRAWDAGNKEILMQQNYSFEDDVAHIKYLLPFFKDSRYIKIDGKPVFVIYRTGLFPDIEKTISIWRTEAAKEGLELYICRFESYASYGEEHMKEGIDAAIDFQPNSKSKIDFMHIRNFPKAVRIIKRWFLKENTNTLLSYKRYAYFMTKYSLSPAYKRYPCITPMWDNSPRKRKNYFVFKGATPALYEKWLSSALQKFQPFSKEENLVFINAWNEWAEGNHLEPCMKWGKSYLEATKKAIQDSECK